MTREWLRDALSNRVTLWLAFVAIHAHLVVENLFSDSHPMLDVIVIYPIWMKPAFTDGYWVGLDSPWVYPILALVPMAVTYAFGPDLFPYAWLALLTLLNVAALGTITGWGRRARNRLAGWWWLVFLVFAGPITLGRLDDVSVALGMVAIVFVATRPVVTGILLTIATWVKIWPATLLLAVVVAVRSRVALTLAAVGTTVVVVIVTCALGGGRYILSFVGTQTGRGLEPGAPITTFWLWFAHAKLPQSYVYNDMGLMAYEVHGGMGSEIASALMTPLMAIATITLVVVGLRARSRGVAAGALAPLLALGLVSSAIVFNKVGSPQYIVWLSVPVVFGLVSGPASRVTFRVPAVAVLVIAALSQYVFPYHYQAVIDLDPVTLAVLSVRNLLFIGLFCWSAVALFRLRPATRSDASVPSGLAKDRPSLAAALD